ncbi:MAG: peptidoglycan editing factor PgeF [Clostridiales bacterium]|uniref:Purine nucleoside phosphorylase n=1 Tax=Candidatus Pullilachnospira stercoravium TaxID=2840913 RepID=A0A9D1NUR2_9FIRM|nr:peptidoglycan editing factor PgeF [Clostridiales bacterium]HIV12459.1 peptidoglycan editing factor PgeF [Candidatus Pullilachnospira stercoravium]
MEILWKHPGHPMTRINQQDGVTFLSFPLLEKTGVVVCGFSTRLGGVSRGCCESMNLSFTRGDDPEAVMENYRRIGHALGISPEQIVCSDQTHTVNVRKVGRDDCGNGITKPKPYRDVDGLITDEAQVALATFYADCVPLYLVDPEKKAIGLAHSGWRGTVGKIGKATVEAMRREYGCRPEAIRTVIGPSICQECYEVSEDVAEAFKKAYDPGLWDRLMTRREDGKYQLNLWEACRENFLEAGILPEHISMPEICTCCNPGFLFSHRASKGKRGNLAAFLMLK